MITIESLTANAKNVATDSPQKFGEAASTGDGFRQGDVLLTKLERVPTGLKKAKTQLQVAPGSTQGSRHIWAKASGLTMYTATDADEFTGPVYRLSETNTLTHPEHGDVEVCPGVYAVSYQRTQDALDRQRRVQD